MLFVNKFSPRFVFSFLCILITACATPQSAREKGAVASYKSTKTAKAISACVAAEWEGAYGITTPVNVRPTEDGYTLQISTDGNTMVVLDVSDIGSGSESRYYKGSVWREDKWDKAVQHCQ